MKKTHIFGEYLHRKFFNLIQIFNNYKTTKFQTIAYNKERISFSLYKITVKKWFCQPKYGGYGETPSCACQILKLNCLLALPHNPWNEHPNNMKPGSDEVQQWTAIFAQLPQNYAKRNWEQDKTNEVGTTLLYCSRKWVCLVLIDYCEVFTTDNAP